MFHPPTLKNTPSLRTEGLGLRFGSGSNMVEEGWIPGPQIAAISYVIRGMLALQPACPNSTQPQPEPPVEARGQDIGGVACQGEEILIHAWPWDQQGRESRFSGAQC